MSGIYVHIPFCRSKCSYCDFYSVVNHKLVNDFINALCLEIDLQSRLFENHLVETIYFGGGTPSILDLSQIEKIITKIYSSFKISEQPEITFEANPNDLNQDYLKGLLKIKVNRLSIGIQSVYQDNLNLLKRKHDFDTALNSVLSSYQAGFENLSIDMIYGIPGLDNEKWKKSLEIVLPLPIKHLSAYHLSIENNTLLYRKLSEGKIATISDDESFEQYMSLLEISEIYGFKQYETSNFAKDEMISKHNSSYWKGTEYLGFGASAHSYYSNMRSWNVDNIYEYLQKINKNDTSFFDVEVLSPDDLFNEQIMLELRTREGLNLLKIEELFGKSKVDKIINLLKNINNDLFELHNGRMILTNKGMFIADNIITSLFE